MAAETANYGLKKPGAEDFYNIEDFNWNADVIDAELAKRAAEGALWNIVYCGGPLLIACALARWRILKGKETFSLIQAVCGVLLALLVSTVFVWAGASERGIPPVSAYGLAVDGVIYAAGLALAVFGCKKRLSRLGGGDI